MLSTVTELFLRGLDCADGGDFARGRDAFDQALQLAPEKPNLWWNRAQCNLALGDMAQVRSDVQRLLALAPEHAGGHALLGKCLLQQGQLCEGVARLVGAWRLDRSNADAAAQALEASLLMDGKENEAVDLALEMAGLQQLHIAQVQKAVGIIMLAPDGAPLAHRLWLGLLGLPTPEEWMYRGWVEHCLNLSNLEEAALACARWAQAFAHSTEAPLQLAAVFAAKGDFAAALPLMGAYIQTAAGQADVLAWCRMVRAMFESRAYEQEAWLLCHSAIERFPHRAEVWVERGHLSLCLGESDLALADFEKALDLFTTNKNFIFYFT